MFHSVLLTFSLLLTGGFVPLEAGLQTLAADDLQGLIRKFESERSLKAHERFTTLQKISEIETRESSEFLAKVIRDPKEETSMVESAIRMVSVHENGVGLEAIFEKGLVQLPERSHWVIRDCWDRDLNDE
ncbi:MAG: hypothetical protein ACPG7R_07580, partial [Planctomycetota bacterium]